MQLPLAITIIGYLGSILIPLAFLPQTIKTIKTRDTKGLSLTCYTIFLIGAIAFLIFGIITSNMQLIVCEAITITFTLLILYPIISNLIKLQRKGVKK